MRKYLFIALFIYTFIPLAVSAHPGNTASDGCHYCRTNCDKWGVAWNERHCHVSKGVPQSSEPIRNIRGDIKGTTVPAPEYKTPAPQTRYQESAPVRTPSIEVSQPNQEKKNFISRFFSWLF